MGTRVDEALTMYREACHRECLYAMDGMSVGLRAWSVEDARRWALELRHAVILEGANVPCELVRDGGG